MDVDCWERIIIIVTTWVRWIIMTKIKFNCEDLLDLPRYYCRRCKFNSCCFICFIVIFVIEIMALLKRIVLGKFQVQRFNAIWISLETPKRFHEVEENWFEK